MMSDCEGKIGRVTGEFCGVNPQGTGHLLWGGGGLQNGKIAGPKLLKSGNFTRPPPYNMAKTSSYRVKTTPKLVVPPLQNG